MSSLIVTGVSGCLKSTIVKNFGRRFPDVNILMNDYYEDTLRYDSLKNPSVSIKLAYMMTKMQSFAKEYKGGNCLSDRSPLDTIMYNEIALELEGIGGTLEECKQRYLNRMAIFHAISEMVDIRGWNILIVVPHENSIAKTLDLMKRRDNGIDIMTLEYVKIQRRIYQEFYDFFKESTTLNVYYYELNHIVHDMDCNLKILMNIINNLMGGICMYSSSLHTNNEFRIGMDLSVTEDCEFKQGQFKTVTVFERIVLPPGLVGLIKTRSSFHSKFITSGVIDPSYSGVLKIGVLPICDFSLRKHERFAQFVIVKTIQTTENIRVLPMASGYDFGRAENGFGSTGSM